MSSAFPLRPDNRPALPRLRYRSGSYPGILAAMLRRLNASGELAKWTHRAPDDPGIALLESGAIVADILTFYQEHYANEAFLRTAQWPESIRELVRLSGYRLAPGLGGRAAFAVEVRRGDPVEVPADFPIKAELAEAPDPVDFLTIAAHTALPQFNRFHLYRARNSAGVVSIETDRFEIATLGGTADPAVLETFNLKAGDKLMIVPPPPQWLTAGIVIFPQAAPQVIKVRDVTHRNGQLLLSIEGRISFPLSGNVTAYRVSRTFRHFGHNTPPMTTYQTGSGSSMTTRQTSAHVLRHVDRECYGSPSSLHTPLPRNILPLDLEVNDLALGSNVIVEALLHPDNVNDPQRVCVAKTIHSLRALTMSWGNVSGPSTWINFGAGAQLVPNHHFAARADIRDFRLHEVTSPVIALTRPGLAASGNFSTTHDLSFYGHATEAALLAGRRLHFQAEDGRFADAVVVSIDAATPAYARLRPVTLDRKPAGFRRNDFDEAEPTVTVFGNIVEVTQGKPEREVALGNGDARQAFQTFKLPKAPLTHLLDPTATPSHVPELTVLVNQREWQRVDSLFGTGPRDEIYLVRDDAKGDSYIQFGDGETGARLPSGVQNVVVRYRTGQGALGLPKPGAKPSAGARLDRLEKLTLAGEVTGGAAGEPAEKARRAAPGRLQGLGRLVSLRDYETETLLIPGVVAAAAAWQVIEGVPAIQLAVLLGQSQQSNAQFAAVEAVIRSADRARGPGRHPIRVIQCELRYVHLAVTYAHDPVLVTADVVVALQAALGLVDDEPNAHSGLFGLHRRRLGEKEYATRIEGTLQNVPGIRWCRVSACGLLPPANDPATLVVPAAPVRTPLLGCTGTELLQLHSRHLALTPATP